MYRDGREKLVTQPKNFNEFKAIIDKLRNGVPCCPGGGKTWIKRGDVIDLYKATDDQKEYLGAWSSEGFSASKDVNLSDLHPVKVYSELSLEIEQESRNSISDYLRGGCQSPSTDFDKLTYGVFNL